jgi:hypothetical protein
MKSTTATPKQVKAAESICQALNGFVPDRPSDVQVFTAPCKSGTGSNTVMLLHFRATGLELVANFYKPKSSNAELLAEIRIHMQPLRSIFRQHNIHIAYEELSQALAGTGVLTILGPDFSEFMHSEMDEELQNQMNRGDEVKRHAVRLAA